MMYFFVLVFNLAGQLVKSHSEFSGVEWGLTAGPPSADIFVCLPSIVPHGLCEWDFSAFPHSRRCSPQQKKCVCLRITLIMESDSRGGWCHCLWMDIPVCTTHHPAFLWCLWGTQPWAGFISTSKALHIQIMLYVLPKTGLKGGWVWRS